MITIEDKKAASNSPPGIRKGAEEEGKGRKTGGGKPALASNFFKKTSTFFRKNQLFYPKPRRGTTKARLNDVADFTCVASQLEAVSQRRTCAAGCLFDHIHWLNSSFCVSYDDIE